MATVTKSIGTSSRNYSTIASWEADLDNTGIYASGDTAIGECYKDSNFDETLTINGGGTVGLAARKLSVASGQRHNGTAGTGARNVSSADVWGHRITIAIESTTIEWLEVDNNSKLLAGALIYNNLANSNQNIYINKCIVHGTGGSVDCSGIRAYGATYVIDTIVYSIVNTGGSYSYGAYEEYGYKLEIYNSTFHSIKNNGSGAARGVYFATDSANDKVKNTISTDAGGSTSGTKACFSPASPSNAVMQYNLSSDTTASGTGSLTSKTSANQFVSTTVGSEDLHLLSTADAKDAGTDLVTTPTGVNIDIDGYDRDSNNVTWDMGADEYVSSTQSQSQTGAGGGIAGGAATNVAGKKQSGAAGGIGGGASTVKKGNKNPVSTGGGLGGGAAVAKSGVKQAGVAGGVAGGSAVQKAGAKKSGVAGGIGGGASTQKAGGKHAGVGGSIAGGAATAKSGEKVSGSGGAIGGGAASQKAGAKVPGAGGGVAGGAANVSQSGVQSVSFSGAGGALSGGSATFKAGAKATGVGGGLAGGAGTFKAGRKQLGSGGATAGGAATTSTSTASGMSYSFTMTGGAVAGGSASVVYMRTTVAPNCKVYWRTKTNTGKRIS